MRAWALSASLFFYCFPSLRNLNPPIAEQSEVRKQILEVCLPHIRLAADVDDEKKKAKSPESEQKRRSEISQILINLGALVASFVSMEPTVSSLNQILQVMNAKKR